MCFATHLVQVPAKDEVDEGVSKEHPQSAVDGKVVELDRGGIKGGTHAIVLQVGNRV